MKRFLCLRWDQRRFDCAFTLCSDIQDDASQRTFQRPSLELAESRVKGFGEQSRSQRSTRKSWEVEPVDHVG